MRRRFFGLEEENDSKPTLLLDKEPESEYDELFLAAKQKAEKTESDQESDTNEEPPGNSTEEPASQETAEESDAEEDQVSMESAIRLYYVDELALEGEFIDKVKSKFSSGVKNIGEKLGLMFDKVFTAVAAGTESIVKYVAKRFESFNRLKGRIGDFQKVLEELKKSSPAVPGGVVFKNKNTIAKLTSSESNDPISAVKVYLAFFNRTGKSLYEGYNKAVEQVRLMIGQSLSDPENPPARYLKFSGGLSGLSEQFIEGYYPPDGTVSFVGPLLPGNVVLVAHIPKENDDITTLRRANRDSKIILAKVQNAGKPEEQLDYYSVDQLTAFADLLLGLAEAGTSQMDIYKDINRTRDSLMAGFKGYARKILTKKDHTGNESVDLISAKFAAIDQTFVSGLMSVHTNAVNLIESGLAFCKYNAKVLAA